MKPGEKEAGAGRGKLTLAASRYCETVTSQSLMEQLGRSMVRLAETRTVTVAVRDLAHSAVADQWSTVWPTAFATLLGALVGAGASFFIGRALYNRQRQNERRDAMRQHWEHILIVLNEFVEAEYSRTVSDAYQRLWFATTSAELTASRDDLLVLDAIRKDLQKSAGGGGFKALRLSKMGGMLLRYVRGERSAEQVVTTLNLATSDWPKPSHHLAAPMNLGAAGSSLREDNWR